MLTSRHDEALSDSEWKTLLAELDFGQLVTWSDLSDSPLVVPAHYVFDGEDILELHLDRRNPAWAVLNDNPRASFLVLDAHVFVPSTWNLESGVDALWSAPTSYYASVQVCGPVEVVDSADDLASLLRRQMRRMQPEGGYGRIQPGDTPYGRMLGAIRGLRLRVAEARTKFKFGGNRSPEVARRIAEQLAERGTFLDLRARSHLLRRLEACEGA